MRLHLEQRSNACSASACEARNMCANVNGPDLGDVDVAQFAGVCAVIGPPQLVHL